MNNFDTVREAIELATPHYQADTERFKQALTALDLIQSDHFTSADMADAQAKAFRDGVASDPITKYYTAACEGFRAGLASIAEQEPVAVVGGQRKGWFYLDGRPNVTIGQPLFAAPVAQQPDRITPAKLAKRIEQGEKWEVAQQPQAEAVPPDPRPVIEMCAKALAEELAAWDIDPPLHHVKEASDACEAWLAATAIAQQKGQP